MFSTQVIFVYDQRSYYITIKYTEFGISIISLFRTWRGVWKQPMALHILLVKFYLKVESYLNGLRIQLMDFMYATTRDAE